LKGIYSLQDFEPVAEKFLPRALYGFISNGAERNVSVTANVEIFNKLAFVPRALVDTDGRTQKIKLLGREYSSPFGIAPMGGSALASYQGDLVFARAAARANIPMIMSHISFMPMEKIAAEGNSWFQIYVPFNPEQRRQLLDRVEKAGFETLVVTVDTPVVGNRDNIAKHGYSMPLKPSLKLLWDGMSHPRWLAKTVLRTFLSSGIPHLENMPSGIRVPLIGKKFPSAIDFRPVSWTEMKQIRETWKGNLIMKGVVSPKDVKLAKEHGFDGVIVSNHGGRQLDGTISTLAALPQIVAVAGDMPVMLDGSIRRGSDVLKALALGARFVFVGRPFLYAAAVGGEAGVSHAIKLLSEEIDRNQALLGLRKLSEMSQEYLAPTGTSE